jgi:hypothetical protein
MKISYKLLLILSLLIIQHNQVRSQSYTAGDPVTLQIPSFSMIATNNAPVSLSLTTNTAGSMLNSSSNSNVYVRITSIVPGATHREITARIASGVVPTGTQLKLISAPSTTTNSGGNLGIPASTPVILDSTDKLLIDNIGTCYTGTGMNDGYRLTYTWEPNTQAGQYGLINSTTSDITITVVLTISSHNSN